MNTTQARSMAYDNPAYLARLTAGLGTITGAAGVSTRHVAHANLLLYGLNVYTLTAGTSTATYTSNGTGTVAVGATTLAVIRITNTATAGASVALSTTTYGPYVVGGSYAPNGTQTNQVGAYSAFQLNTNTGTAGLGGILINQGDQFYVVNGTDATASLAGIIDYSIQPGAGLNS